MINTRPSVTSLLGNTSGVQSVVGMYPAYFSGGSNVTLQGSSDSGAFTLGIHAAAGGTGAGAGIALAAGTQTATTNTVALANSNGISFGMSGSSQITASYTVPLTTQFLTTAALSDHSHGNPTLALTNLSGTTASASNGLTLSLSAAAPGAGGGIAAAAGTQTATSGTVYFANSNGITFGMTGSAQITASHNGLTSQSNQAASAANGSFTFQTLSFGAANGVSFSTGTDGIVGSVFTGYAASTHSHGNPTLALTNLSGTTASASNGLTLSLSAAAPAAGSISFSAGTQTTNAAGFTFSNSNGVSFGMAAQVVTASHNGLTTQSAQAVSVPAGSSTFETLRFADSNGVSWGTTAGGVIASVATTYAASNHSHGNPTLALTNLSGTTASASNGLTLSLSAAAPGAGGGIAAAAGTQTGSSGTVAFVNSNNVTFGMSGSTQITASVPTSSIVGATGLNVSSAGSTISVYQQPASFWHDHPPGAISSSQQTNSQMTVRRLILPAPIAFTRIDIPILVSITSAGNANTANIVVTSGLGIYTRNGATLNAITGSIGNTTYTWASNSANYSSIIGGRFASFPLQSTLTEGEYYIVAKISTNNNSSIGTATTALANTISVLIGSTYTALNFAEFGAVTGASTTGLAFMQGLVSVDYTGTAQTWQQSQISMSGAPGARANIHLRFLS